MSTLVLPSALRAQIESEARAAYPHECCGLIEGVREGDSLHATALHPARNLSAESDRFEIDPADHFAALRAARGHGQEIIGCYHSHPNGRAEPSPRDCAGAAEAGFLWLVAALEAGSAVTLGAYVFDGEVFLPSTLAG